MTKCVKGRLACLLKGKQAPHDSVKEGLDRVSEPECQWVVWVVTHWRCGLSLAYKGCERSGHSQICMGDIVKDLATREQDVGMAHVLASRA